MVSNFLRAWGYLSRMSPRALYYPFELPLDLKQIESKSMFWRQQASWARILEKVMNCRQGWTVRPTFPYTESRPTCHDVDTNK